MIIKILFTVIFLAVMIGVGLYTRKKASSVEGFVLGGRAVGPWLTAFAFGTSYFSAVVFVGYAGQFGWKYGLSSAWIGIGNAIIGSLLAWLILGRRTKLMTQHIESRTMPEHLKGLHCIDVALLRLGDHVARVTAERTGEPLESRLLVQHLVKLIDGKALMRQIQERSCVNVARARAHDKPGKRGEPHGGVDALTALDSGYRAAVAEMARH